MRRAPNFQPNLMKTDESIQRKNLSLGRNSYESGVSLERSGGGSSARKSILKSSSRSPKKNSGVDYPAADYR